MFFRKRPPEDIGAELDALSALLRWRDWDAVETAAGKQCTRFAPQDAAQIQRVSLREYEAQLRGAISEALEKATAEIKAIYLEYDLDNGWESTLFLCAEYSAASDGNDDWATDWVEEVPGPAFDPFGQLYHSEFDRTPEALVSTVYLVGRTVAAFARAADGLELGGRALCIAFHDQDPIMRIEEISASLRRAALPSRSAAPPKDAAAPVTEVLQKVKYVFTHFAHLASPAELEAVRVGKSSKSKEARALVARGWPTYPLEIIARIERDHPGGVHYNLCPRCQKLCRTPTARQCPHCHLSWHAPS